MEREEYEDELERAANRKLMDESMRSQLQNGPDAQQNLLQPPTPKRKVKVKKVRRQSVEVSSGGGGVQA